MSISRRLEDIETIGVLSNQELEGAGIVYQEIVLMTSDYENDLEKIKEIFREDWQITGRENYERYFMIDGEEKKIKPDIILKKNIKNTHRY